MNKNSETNTATISREETITILANYEKSHDTIRNIIRQHLSEKVFSNIVAATIQSKSIGVIRYLNTINYVLNQIIKQNSMKGISNSDMNRLRLALFEGIWQKIPFQNLISIIQTKEHLKILAEALQFDLYTRVKSINYYGQNSLLYSHPTFLIETLTEKLGREDTIKLLKKNNSPAKSYLRVNQFIKKQDEIVSILKENGVLLKKDNDIPFLFEIKEGLMAAVNSDFFRNGKIFIQDKASVFAVTALDP
ncbi:MAG: hypothetical protein GNW80_17355, partial [Asgard group archaeon]|nr:hypothetical protein [Asgard group archaeon]